MTTDRMLLIATAHRHAKDGTGKAIRQAAGLSLSDIGRVVGADGSTVWRWEEGITRPRGDRGARWAELLNQLDQVSRAA